MFVPLLTGSAVSGDVDRAQTFEPLVAQKTQLMPKRAAESEDRRERIGTEGFNLIAEALTGGVDSPCGTYSKDNSELTFKVQDSPAWTLERVCGYDPAESGRILDYNNGNEYRLHPKKVVSQKTWRRMGRRHRKNYTKHTERGRISYHHKVSFLQRKAGEEWTNVKVDDVISLKIPPVNACTKGDHSVRVDVSQDLVQDLQSRCGYSAQEVESMVDATIAQLPDIYSKRPLVDSEGGFVVLRYRPKGTPEKWMAIPPGARVKLYNN
jgi:hypothetical protein